MAGCLALGTRNRPKLNRHTHPLDYLEQLPGSVNPYLQGRETKEFYYD